MLLTVTGCSSWLPNYQDLQEPRVSLTGLALKDANFLAPSFLVRLRVENPNDVSLNLDGADAALSLNGQTLARGVSRSPLTLVKGGTSEMDVEVTADTLTVVQQIAALANQPSARYQVTGHLSVLNWLGALGRLPFSFEGTVDSKSLLKGL
jgi:LEA14-like dessication related protein